MIAFPVMLVEPATKAGIKVPDNPEEYQVARFLHWHVFLTLQIGRPMPAPTSHWDNAKIVGAIPIKELRGMTFGDVIARGFQ